MKKEVEKARLREREAPVIALARENDTFVRKKQRHQGFTGLTELVIKDIMDMVNEVGKKSDCAVVVGVLPRPSGDDIAKQKALRINWLLGMILTEKGIGFVDLFDEFYGKSRMYAKD